MAAAAARPVLYYALFSPPSRACLLTSKVIGLNLELKAINFAQREHLSDWYLKINPRHTVPVLVDQGQRLCDSHAIMTYMVGQYGGDGDKSHEHLYPRQLLQRAIVDERLYYENGVLFQVIRDFVAKIMYGGEIAYSSKSIQLAHSAYASLEEFLSGADGSCGGVKSKYVAGGEQMSVADISINTTLITLHKLVAVEERRYPHIYAWMQRMRRELPDYEEVNERGAEQLFQRFEDALVTNMTKTC